MAATIEDLSTCRADELPVLLSIGELATRLRCSLSCAKQLIYSGRIRSIKVGRLTRIPRDGLIAFESGEAVES